MSDLGMEEPIIDFTRQPQKTPEPVIDFTKRNEAPVKEKAPERKMGTVGRRNESALARIARARSARVALAALGTAGVIKATVSNLGLSGESVDNGVVVTQVHAEEKPMLTEQATHENIGHFDEIFHDLDETQRQEARAIVDDFKNRIFEKSNYIEAHRNIPTQYRRQIEQTAKMYGLSPDTLLGIISVENGGGTAVMNESSGALGVAQFLPDTARQYGLLVNDQFDQRTDPVKSIAAAGKYLEVHKRLFGDDEGLAIWSYHAGVGNVFRAMRVYFQDQYQVDIGDYVGAIVANDPVARENVEEMAHEMMAKDGLDLYKLLSNPAVQSQVTDHLDDYSDSYPYAVVAAGELLREQNNGQLTLASAPNTSR